MPDALATFVGPDDLRLARRGVVAFAHIGWGGAWYSRHQILRRLSRSCPVAIVDPPVEARDVLSGRADRRPALKEIAPGLWSYRPPRWLPLVYRPAAAAWATAELRRSHLLGTLRRLGLVNPIHYVWHPDYAAILGRLPRRFTIYHRYDKYDAYENVSVGEARAQEREVAARADLLIASSRVMAADLERLVDRPVRHLPHGVDFEFFHERAKREPTPEDLARLPGPRIGLVARLAENMDDRAIAEIATQRPAWSIVLIGPDGYRSTEGRERFRALISLPNVHALGPRPREDVPAYIAGLDVALLCYRMDNWGGWVQPIKAYEYLACGRPIVSSPIDAAADLGNLVRVVDSADGWVRTIEAALQSDTAEEIARRLSFARRNTWDDRVSELVRVIEEALRRETALDHRTATMPDPRRLDKRR